MQDHPTFIVASTAVCFVACTVIPTASPLPASTSTYLPMKDCWVYVLVVCVIADVPRPTLQTSFRPAEYHCFVSLTPMLVSLESHRPKLPATPVGRNTGGTTFMLTQGKRIVLQKSASVVSHVLTCVHSTAHGGGSSWPSSFGSPSHRCLEKSKIPLTSHAMRSGYRPL